jgi:catechol 2,3-dioxygenase-like lactoylglutathione lyase family enzyme
MLEAFESAVTLYDQGTINRRELFQRLVALGIGGRALGLAGSAGPSKAPFHVRTLNHLSLYPKDLARSRKFYEVLTGLPLRDQGADFCEFRLEDAFLGLYAPDAGHTGRGFDHFCFGIDGYDAQRAYSTLKRSMPEARPTLEPGDQVYVRDPDGVRVQFADVSYKR